MTNVIYAAQEHERNTANYISWKLSRLGENKKNMIRIEKQVDIVDWMLRVEPSQSEETKQFQSQYHAYFSESLNLICLSLCRSFSLRAMESD